MFTRHDYQQPLLVKPTIHTLIQKVKNPEIFQEVNEDNLEETKLSSEVPPLNTQSNGKTHNQ